MIEDTWADTNSHIFLSGQCLHLSKRVTGTLLKLMSQSDGNHLNLNGCTWWIIVIWSWITTYNPCKWMWSNDAWATCSKDDGKLSRVENMIVERPCRRDLLVIQITWNDANKVWLQLRQEPQIGWTMTARQCYFWCPHQMHIRQRLKDKWVELCVLCSRINPTLGKRESRPNRT